MDSGSLGELDIGALGTPIKTKDHSFGDLGHVELEPWAISAAWGVPEAWGLVMPVPVVRL